MKRYAVAISIMVFYAAVLCAAGESVGLQTGEYSDFPDSVRMLDGVDVVAFKSGTDLRNRPQASTYVGAPELERLNVAQIKGISEVVPNFFVPDYGSRITSSIYVRGIGARMDQPAVGLNVDNVPVLNKNAFDFDLADIAGVEMIRGPQGTLYGRNTIGGVVNVRTLSPFEWQGWRAMASGATANEWKASAGWYARLSGKTALSVCGNVNTLGGFQDNSFTGKRCGTEKGGALRSKFIWKPAANVTVDNVASSSLFRQNGYAYRDVESGMINYNDPCFYRRFVFHDGLAVQWDASSFKLSSVTSLQYLDDDLTLDQDFKPVSYFTLTQRQKDFALTQEIMLKGDAAGNKYQWIAGAFGFYKTMRMEAPVTFKDDGISTLIESHRNEANPDFPVRWAERSFPLESKFNSPSGGIALFHQSRFRMGKLSVNAGLRLDVESTRLRYHSRCNTSYDVFRYGPDGQLEPYRNVGIDIDDRGQLEKTYLNWLPALQLQYDLPLSGINNVYINVSKGYKAGGFNTQMFSDVLQQRLMAIMGLASKYDVDDVVGYKPESSWNYEAGFHLSFPSVALYADVGLFSIDCRNQQLTTFPDGTTTGRIMTNAGRTRSCGFEADIRWSPLSDWNIRASWGHTQAKFRKYFNGINDFKGKYLPYVPSNTLFLQTDYGFAVSNTGLVRAITIGVDLKGAGRIYWNEGNTLKQPFYLQLGASVTLNSKNADLEIWGRNITDTRFDTFYFMSMGNEFLQRGRPLQLGATLRLFFPE